MNVLSKKTLVLNRHGYPVNTTTVKEAICDVFAGRAAVIDTETFDRHSIQTWIERGVVKGNAVVRASTIAFDAPSVISMQQFDRLPKMKVVFNRRNLYRHYKFTCQYCGKRPGPKELSIDHVIPVSRGGKTNWTNCTLACTNCNKKKGDRLPSKCGMYPRKRPVEPVWDIRFALDVRKFPHDWQSFLPKDISEMYWDVELEHD